MRSLQCAAVVIAFLAVGSLALGDWTETANDGGAPALDNPVGLGGWVAAFNGADPIPATTFYEASDLAPTFGVDPGWNDNVVAISDADATRYAAANQIESFTDVAVTVSCSTIDPDTEEFGVLARTDFFGVESPIDAVDGYAAMFSANGAADVGDPLQFTLYRIDNGDFFLLDQELPGVPTGANDLIVCIELTAIGGQLAARLYEDADKTHLLAELTATDSTYASGFSGVVSQDVTPGIGALYDTLSSETVVPEPSTAAFLIAGLAIGVFGSRRRQRHRCPPFIAPPPCSICR